MRKFRVFYTVEGPAKVTPVYVKGDLRKAHGQFDILAYLDDPQDGNLKNFAQKRIILQEGYKYDSWEDVKVTLELSPIYMEIIKVGD